MIKENKLKRPKMPEARKPTVTIRVSKAEKEYIHKKAKQQANGNVSLWVRHRLWGKESPRNEFVRKYMIERTKEDK